MCTLVVLRRPGHDWPLILGANRDEMIARPWRAPGRHWPDRPDVVAGLDELAGGSWLGLNEHGVIAGILNRFGTLGPAPGQRSRGELVLEALDHADARDAAAALAQIDPRAYRPFNMIIADNRDAFWIRHADPNARAPSATPLAPGLAMIAAGELDESETPRLKRYRPRFASAAPPDPGKGDWQAWESLLADTESSPHDGPAGAMRFTVSERGFATVSSALLALPAAGIGARPFFRFRAWQPEPTAWRDILAG
jgi:uncharacterized protein with NRDE domain